MPLRVGMSHFRHQGRVHELRFRQKEGQSISGGGAINGGIGSGRRLHVERRASASRSAVWKKPAVPSSRFTPEARMTRSRLGQLRGLPCGTGRGGPGRIASSASGLARPRRPPTTMRLPWTVAARTVPSGSMTAAPTRRAEPEPERIGNVRDRAHPEPAVLDHDARSATVCTTSSRTSSFEWNRSSHTSSRRGADSGGRASAAASPDRGRRPGRGRAPRGSRAARRSSTRSSGTGARRHRRRRDATAT